MSSSTIVVLAVVVIAVLAILFIATAGARRDRTSAMSLRREARRKDTANPALAGDELTGREWERNAVLERRGGDVVPVSASPRLRIPRHTVKGWPRPFIVSRAGNLCAASAAF